MSLFRKGKGPFISDNQQVNSSNRSLPGDKIVRVYVTLGSGARIVVLINAKFTVAQLVTESIRRATSLDLPYDARDTMLRLNDGSIVFEEDTVEDVLDLTGNDSFFLGPFQPQSQSSEVASLTAVSKSSDLTPYWLTVVISFQRSQFQLRLFPSIHIPTTGPKVQKSIYDGLLLVER